MIRPGIGERQAAIAAWFSESLEQTAVGDLCADAPRGLFTRFVKA
ncbi:hypothetical protein GCM10023144_07310 [Pigmentiphaga soli]|uniref:Uncharacterized protein n=1 Tax=Pigmentiphaga soli TaxID=1007095 RepID=A0ABP8GIR8_9BURK